MSALGLLLLALPNPAAQEKLDLLRQIHWQRSLEDALAIARDEGRPLFIAVNMDGESASERIVREQYRDAAFVESTLRFVCVVASVFRHTPRDHAPNGQRILCPRLGDVTCGEHIELEPLLFERFLGGERIAPRHALVALDGTKHFDLSLLFDLSEVGRRLTAAQGLAPGPSSRDHPRSHRAQLALEYELATADAPAVSAWLERARQASGPPDLDALRRLWVRVSELDPEVVWAATALARERGLETEVARGLAELVQDVGFDLLDPALGGGRLLLEGFLERVAAADPALRSLCASYRIAGFDPYLPLRTDWSTAAIRPKPPEPELPGAETLEAELLAVEEELALRPGDAALEERRGRAALGLARRRIESGGSGIEFLLTDAALALARASEARPDDPALLLERARAAFYLARFEDQERNALAALAGIPVPDRGPASGLFDPSSEPGSGEQGLAAMFAHAHAHEALRWLGDASARLLAERSGGELAAEQAGIRRGALALSLAALAPTAEASDWRTLSGFWAALGRRREEIAFALKGLERFPDDDELHAALAIGLNSVGLPERLTVEASRVAEAHPASARAHWYVGHALVGLADWLRRGEDPESAIAAYDEAQRAFEASVALEPAFADSVEHYVALSALGRGFAHLLAERQAEAARELVLAIETRPAIASVRDGLDREALDLLDGALEARARGPSPVDALALMGELAQADPGNAAWPRAISDSQLREALRAAGRGAPDAARGYFERACTAARSAVALGGADEDRRALAQATTTLAERWLALGDTALARPLLAEAAPLMAELIPAPAASEVELRELTARLREGLGAARPIPRPGR